MAEVEIRDLQTDASAVVAMAAAGEWLTILEDGSPVARIVPYVPSRIEDMIADGRARPALRKLSDLPLPEPRQRDEGLLSEELERMRRSERY